MAKRSTKTAKRPAKLKLGRKTPKKRNPQDSTLRNVRATTAKLDELRGILTGVRALLDELMADLKTKGDRIAALEARFEAQPSTTAPV